MGKSKNTYNSHIFFTSLQQNFDFKFIRYLLTIRLLLKLLDNLFPLPFIGCFEIKLFYTIFSLSYKRIQLNINIFVFIGLFLFIIISYTILPSSKKEFIFSIIVNIKQILFYRDLFNIFSSIFNCNFILTYLEH